MKINACYTEKGYFDTHFHHIAGGMIMKRTIVYKLPWLAMLCAVLLVAAAGAALGDDVTKTIDAAPFIENGRVYDTVRPVAETFGIYVDWDQEAQKATMTRGTLQVVMEVGSSELALVTLDGVESISLEAAPILRDGRLFLPTRYWAGAFGLEVVWHEADGSVTVSEGVKTLAFAPGSHVLSLTGGHFLRLYDQDERLSFFYPEHGDVAIVWDGYAEILLTVRDVKYVIVAMNAGIGRSDPINYTMEEFDRLIYDNADAANGSVRKLSNTYYGVPAYRITGLAAGIPQAGVIFLRSGYLCGLTIEVKQDQGSSMVQESILDILVEGDEDDGTFDDDEPLGLDGNELQREFLFVNALLDEIMASLVVR
jgi:hypothetical protein